MGMQIILCVESDKRAGTDNIYIKETINRFYEYGNELKISFVNMGGKSNYNSSKVKSAVKQLKSDYKIGKTEIIYCIDLDRIEVNPDQARENKEIEKYIADNGYSLIWFCHDVEEVYLGQSLDKSKKTRSAMNFKTRSAIDTIDYKKLDSVKIKSGASNILFILDKYMCRKTQKIGKS